MKKALFSRLLSGVMALGLLGGNSLLTNRVCGAEDINDELDEFGGEMGETETQSDAHTKADSVDTLTRWALGVLDICPTVGPLFGHVFAGGKGEGWASLASGMMAGVVGGAVGASFIDKENKKMFHLLAGVGEFYSKFGGNLSDYKGKESPTASACKTLNYRIDAEGNIWMSKMGGKDTQIGTAVEVGKVVALYKLFTGYQIQLMKLVEDFGKVIKDNNGDYWFGDKKLEGLQNDQYTMLKKGAEHVENKRTENRILTAAVILNQAGWSVYDICKALGKI